MKTRNIIALVVAGTALFGSLFATTALAGPPKKGGKKPAPVTKKADTKVDGKKVYDKFSCSACHAISGKGGNSGPDLSKTGGEANHDAKFFEAKVKNPKASNPDTSMPAYEETIKGKDLSNLVAYLKSLK
ncbi:MAG: c-type cytochrome [Armatimonadetes bacterium]|nr:c-type cytochrome [Armatimonadota bacterium]